MLPRIFATPFTRSELEWGGRLTALLWGVVTALLVTLVVWSSSPAMI